MGDEYLRKKKRVMREIESSLPVSSTGRCNTIIRSSVQHSRVKQLGRGARERERERKMGGGQIVDSIKINQPYVPLTDWETLNPYALFLTTISCQYSEHGMRRYVHTTVPLAQHLHAHHGELVAAPGLHF